MRITGGSRRGRTLITPDSDAIRPTADKTRLAVFNMLPIPPLDGFQAIAPWLAPETRDKLFGLSNIGLFLVLLAFWFIPPVNLALWGSVRQLCSFFDVEPIWIMFGQRAFRFWDH